MRERQRERKRAPVSLLCLLPGNNILRCAANGSHAWRKLHLRKKKNSIFHGGFWRWPFCLGSIASVRISAQTGVDNEISLESPTAYHGLNISVGRGISNDWFYLLVNTQRHKNVHAFLLCWGVNTLLQFILTLCHIGSHIQLRCSQPLKVSGGSWTAAFQKVSEVQDPLESTKGSGFTQIIFLGCLVLISGGTVVCWLPLGLGFESTGWLRPFCVKFVYLWVLRLPFTIHWHTTWANWWS